MNRKEKLSLLFQLLSKDETDGWLSLVKDIYPYIEDHLLLFCREDNGDVKFEKLQAVPISEWKQKVRNTLYRKKDTFESGNSIVGKKGKKVVKSQMTFLKGYYRLLKKLPSSCDLLTLNACSSLELMKEVSNSMETKSPSLQDGKETLRNWFPKEFHRYLERNGITKSQDYFRNFV